MKWIIGLAAGAAAIYFLRTEKGKEFVQDLKKETGSLGDSLYTLAEGLFKKGTSLAGKAAEQAKNVV